MALNVLASAGTVPATKSPGVARRSAEYHPSVWGDKFLEYSNSDNLKDDAFTEKKLQHLKEEVKKMLLETVDKPQQQLNLINEIQRLGLSYHFEPEIETALQKIHDIYDKYCYSTNVHDLHDIALCFRLLRQHGFRVSSDTFCKFIDSEGKLKEYLLKDARGMLSLFEATQFRLHGEYILEEALSLTTSHLEHLKSYVSDALADEINNALKRPIHKEINRLGERYYISIYEKYDSHNKMLLELAKLDFNRMQKMYQQELASLTRWWKDLDFANKLPFVRDRLVECYFWSLGVYFEPEYNLVRNILTKIFGIISAIDDMYDVYATFDEPLERWETSALDQLPQYMKIIYQTLLDIYNQMEEEMAKKPGTPLYRVQFAKQTAKDLFRSYLDEARMAKDGYISNMEEYMTLALVSYANVLIIIASFVGMGDKATKEVFEWVFKCPLLVKASNIISRLSNDIVGHELELKKGDTATAVESYMKEYNVTKEEAYAALRKQIDNAWKDMNQESLRPFPIPMTFITRILHLSRVTCLVYDDGEDGYTNSRKAIKGYITSLLVDPVPL